MDNIFLVGNSLQHYTGAIVTVISVQDNSFMGRDLDTGVIGSYSISEDDFYLLDSPKHFVTYYDKASAFETHGNSLSATQDIINCVMQDKAAIELRLTNSNCITEKAYCNAMLETIERVLGQLEHQLAIEFDLACGVAI